MKPKYDPGKHKRRSIRLKHYDYTRGGAYVVTIVAQHRQCLFGEIIDSAARFGEAGEMVEARWAH